MNKKTNTLLFVLGATVFNVIVCIVSFIALFFLYAKFLYPVLPGESQPWSFFVIFAAGIAISILVYRIVLKTIIKKVDIEKYFDPIFTRGRGSVRKD